MSVTLSVPRYDELRDKEHQLELSKAGRRLWLNDQSVKYDTVIEELDEALKKSLTKLAATQESLAKDTARLETVRIELGPLRTDHGLYLKDQARRKPIIPLTFWQRLKFLFKGAHS